MTDPTIVVCDATSYVGTTWMNLLVGSHPMAMSLGPTHKLWDRRDEGFEGVCLIHGKDCDFWTGFSEVYTGENFFRELSAYSGRTHFLFDNPTPDFVAGAIEKPGLNVKRIRYLRDARAVTASYARRTGETYYDTILPDGWYYPSFLAVPKPGSIPDQRVVRYEDAARNPRQFVREISTFIGLDLQDTTTRFWEGDHHITVGNGGPVNMVKMHQGRPIPNFESKAVYEEQYAKMVADPEHSFFDERWKRQLTREDLFHFDLLMGEKNAELGYERDTFTDAEIKEFWERYGYEAHVGERKPLPDAAMFEGQTRYNAAVERLASAPVAVEPSEAAPEVPAQQTQVTDVGPAPAPAPYVEGEPERLTEGGEIVTDAKPAGTESPAVEPSGDVVIPKAAVAPTPGLGLNGHANALQYFRNMPHLLDPCDEGTRRTTYYDTVDPERLAEKKPYIVEPSTWDDDYLRLAVNLNHFQAYGPAFEHKVTMSVGMDTMLHYGQMLKKLQANPRVRFRTFADALNNPPQGDEVCVIVRHDVDGDIFAAVEMAEIEDRLGIATSYYLLHTAPYYAVPEDGVYKRHEATVPYYQRLQELGQEVGVHTDSLTLLQYQDIRGDEALPIEIERLRSHGLEIVGTLAHNSFGIYGACNYAQFKGRPSDTRSLGRAVAVEHDGRWSPLRQLDEEALGLTYEGNDALWQDHTRLEFYSLNNQNWWRCVSNYYGSANVEAHRPDHHARLRGQPYATVIDEVLAMEGPCYVMLVCHPLSNGMRASVETPMESHRRAFGDKALEAVCGEQVFEGTSFHETIVEGEYHDPITLRWGIADGYAEFISMACENEAGQEDRPYEMIAGEDVRVLTIGRSFMAGRSVLMDTRFPQMVTRLLRVRMRNRVKIGGTSFTFDDYDKSKVREVLRGLPEEAPPQILFLGLNESDADTGGKGSFVDAMNLLDRTGISIIGVLEMSDVTEDEAMSRHSDVARRLRDYFEFPIVDPYEGFEAYAGGEPLYRKSLPEWSELAHHIAADRASEVAFQIARHYGGKAPDLSRLAKL